MEKRTFLAVAICLGILMLWWQLFPPPKTSAPLAPAVATAPGAATPRPESPQPADPSGVAATAGAPATPAPAVETVVLQTTRATYRFSNVGGILEEVTLKDLKFRERAADPASGLAMLGAPTPGQAPLRITFPKADFKIPEHGTWRVEKAGDDDISFLIESDAVALRRRIKVDPGSLAFLLEFEVVNRTDRAQSHILALHLSGRQDPKKKGGGFWDMASADLATMACLVDGSRTPEREPVESLFKEPKTVSGAIGWIAADTKYFAVAAVPHPESPPRPGSCERRAFTADHGEVSFVAPERSVPAHGKTVHTFTIFAGPKYAHELDEVKPGGLDPELAKVVDVTFAVLARPLLFLLKLFHRWVGNWGLAIIMLTLFVKLLTFYPTQRAMMSGKKMQHLAPKLNELRQKYEGDRQRLGIETMNLYRAHGVSPFGGCLPSLITMPIWIALFSTLNYAVDLHRTPFVGYIQDLSARDPYFITPLLMGGIMYLQMRMSPAGADPQQQKMMAVMMPVMFTAFSLFLPAGLALYTLTNSLLAILQQVLVNRIADRQAVALT
jgi:YidC/Oxa1 family membrane protein insertase